MATRRKVNKTFRQLDPTVVVELYHALTEKAPRRHDRNKKYFVGHTGIPSSGDSTNRDEEHLAIALTNRTLEFSDGWPVELVDYQVPLKARSGDAGLGKVDIFGVDLSGRHVIVELKIAGASGRSDTPLRAVLEGLTYSAVLLANQDAIDEELAEMDVRLRTNADSATSHAHRILVAAPTDYWRQWDAFEGWLEAASKVLGAIAQGVGASIELVDLGAIGVELGLSGRPPRLKASGLSVDDPIPVSVLSSWGPELG